MEITAISTHETHVSASVCVVRWPVPDETNRGTIGEVGLVVVSGESLVQSTASLYIVYIFVLVFLRVGDRFLVLVWACLLVTSSVVTKSRNLSPRCFSM